MGATIMYQQVKPQPSKSVYCSAPQNFLRSMRDAFGESDYWELEDKHLPTLGGMAAVFGMDDDNPYRELIHAIDKLGKIKVWAEY